MQSYVIPGDVKNFPCRTTHQTQNICMTFVQRQAQPFRLRADVVQMLFKCFEFAGYGWYYPAKTKHLNNICTTSARRLRRWADVVQMLFKCFVFAGYGWYYPAKTKPLYNICRTSARRLRRWADVVQMLFKCFVFAG